MKRTTLISIIFILSSVSLVFAQKQTSRVDKNLTIFNDVLRQLDISYADTLNYDDLVATAVHQMLRKIDPYTVYVPQDKTQDLRLMTTGKYGGIGAMIMQRQDSFPEMLKKYKSKNAAERYVAVSEPYEGMPAQKNDVRAGDILIEVDGKNVVGKTTAEVSSLLRGVPHSTVTLKILRVGHDKPLTIAFEREEIKLPPVVYYGTISELDTIKLEQPVGYILFNEFTEGSAELFRSAVEDMQKNGNIGGLVIDLRNNGGGIIDEAVKIMSYFVEKGTEIVSTKGRNKNANRTYKTTTQPRFLDMPLAVLVNSSSASAAEIVAGSLQDLDRAVLIGTRTYGKGLVQSIRPIAYNGHLKVTTSKYYIPSGRCIQAIDYSKRRQDGSVERVPDSLTHEFKTKKGRIVRDGGGIEPDILIEDDSAKVDITYTLYVNQYFFDFATIYRNCHDSISALTEFEVTDKDLNDFISFLKERNFKYQTETSRYYDVMLDMANHEDLDSTVIAELTALKLKLTPSFEEAIMQHSDEVKQMLAHEIIERYYFQRGAVVQSLKDDKFLHQALLELRK